MTPSPEVVDLYLRKSTKDEGRSVDRQRHELTEAAEEEGLTVGRIFVDPHFSASRYRRHERPEYTALLDYMRSGDCKIVGILESSRGSRDLTEWSTFLDLCRTMRIKVWVATHDRVYDLSRRRDWKALADEGVAAADESERISERTRSGKRKAAREGRPIGQIPYGFTRVYSGPGGKTITQIPHPEQAPIVAEMVQRVADGETTYAIAKDLNDRGIKTPEGNRWLGRLVGQMVRRESSAGLRLHQGDVFGPAAWEPIVDPDTWRRAVAILGQPERVKTRGTGLVHWLNMVITCGACKSFKLRSSTQGKSPIYACVSEVGGCGAISVRAKPVEDVLAWMIKARSKQPDALIAYRPRVDDVATARVEKELKALKGRLKEIYAEAAKGLSAKGLATVEGLIQKDIDRLEKEKRRLLPPVVRDLDMVDVESKWDDFTSETKRTYATVLADLVVSPATRRGPVFDVNRLGASRWKGDGRTWSEIWAAGEELPTR